MPQKRRRKKTKHLNPNGRSKEDERRLQELQQQLLHQPQQLLHQPQQLLHQPQQPLHQQQQQEEEDNNKRMCNMCHFTEGEDEEEEDLGKLMQVCPCKGSIKFVHDKCLSQWFLINPSRKRECPTCFYQFQFSEELKPWREWRLEPMLPEEKKLFFRDVALCVMFFPICFLIWRFSYFCAESINELCVPVSMQGYGLFWLMYICSGHLFEGSFIDYIYHTWERNEYYFSRPWRNNTQIVIKPYEE